MTRLDQLLNLQDRLESFYRHVYESRDKYIFENRDRKGKTAMQCKVILNKLTKVSFDLRKHIVKRYSKL